MNLPDDNEYILTLIGDINALRREIEQIRNDQTICNGIKEIQINYVKEIIRKTYERLEEERRKILQNN